jgi:F0F1-type ATP synthase membrane subunit b/b'
MEGLAKLGINWLAVLTYLVNTGFILYIINRFAVKPIATWAEKRRETIASNIDAVEKLKNDFSLEIEKERKENQDKLKSLENNINESRIKAEIEAETILKDAHSQKDEIIKKAYSEVELIKKQTIESLEEELLAKVTKVVVTAMRTNSTPEKTVTIIRQQWKERNY